MAAYYERMLVNDIAALKTLTDATTPQIADGIFIGVRDIGNGDPSFFHYKADSVISENIPVVITPNSGIGRWFLFMGKASVNTDLDPNRPPAFPGELWIRLDSSTGDPSVSGIWTGILVSGSLDADFGLNIGGGAWQRTY